MQITTLNKLKKKKKSMQITTTSTEKSCHTNRFFLRLELMFNRCVSRTSILSATRVWFLQSNVRLAPSYRISLILPCVEGNIEMRERKEGREQRPFKGKKQTGVSSRRCLGDHQFQICSLSDLHL